MSEERINIAICDDESIFCNEVYDICDRYMKTLDKDYYIKSFLNGKDLLKDEMEFTIIFLDVSMPGQDGFSVARELNKRKTIKDTYIIYLTSRIEMMSKAFEVRAFRYLIKPCNEQEICETLGIAINEALDNQVVLLEEMGKIRLLKLKDIYYIESLWDGTCVHYMQETIITSKSLKDWIHLLNDDFYQCHKSYIVNLFNIKLVDKNKVVLVNEMEVKVSVRNKKGVIAVFKNYIRKNARYL